MTPSERPVRAIRRAVPALAAAAAAVLLVTVVWPAVRTAPRLDAEDPSPPAAVALPPAPTAPALPPAASDVSPDGRRTAFVVPTRAASEVWIARPDGSAPERAIRCTTAACVRITDPAFAPTSDRLLVVQHDRVGTVRGPSQLVVLDLRTGRTRTIARTPDGTSGFEHARWLPSGGAVVVQRTTYDDPRERTVRASALQVVPIATGRARTITPEALLARHPDARAPDGLVVFAGEDVASGSQGVFTVRPDGSSLRRLTPPDARRYGFPRWLRGGGRAAIVVGTMKQSGHGLSLEQRAATVTFPGGWLDLAP